MIIENKSFSLYGKEIFNKITILPPFEVQNQMLNEACLLYTIEGEQIATSQTEQLTARKGEAILEKCGNYLNGTINKKSSNRFITVHFYPEILKKLYDNELPKYLKPSYKNPLVSNMTKVQGNKIIEKYFDSILFYFENQGLVDDEILKLKIKELILLLVKTQNDQMVTSILSNLFTPSVYNLKEIVTAHLYSSISIDSLAKLCALSRSTFIREFKKEYQHTPALYIKNKKLERAAELLKFSSESVGNIAYDSGFNNLAHFSRSFYTKYKSSPSKYRLKQTGKYLNR